MDYVKLCTSNILQCLQQSIYYKVYKVILQSLHLCRYAQVINHKVYICIQQSICYKVYKLLLYYKVYICVDMHKYYITKFTNYCYQW